MATKLVMPQSVAMVDQAGNVRPEWVQFLTALVRTLNDVNARLAKIEVK
jgi:hypothetical protein